MELRHLRYFVAVAEELNFRRAAERLHLAQPSLGRQVRDLEEEIGARLFDRDRRRVTLTDAGRVLLAEARTLLAGADSAIRAARDAGRAQHNTLRIGHIGPLTGSFLASSLAALHDRFPRVPIDVVELSSDEQLAALLKGEIQVGFQGGTLDLRADRRFSTRRVLACNAVVVVPGSHPLARKKTFPLRVLAGETLLNLQPRPGATYELWLRAICAAEPGGFSPRLRRPPADSWNTLLGLVAAGEGLAVVPEVILRDVRHDRGWTVKPLSAPRPRVEVDAVW
ncbi:MAG TPA: LysR substrate-binding domain-containing protein, partial [Chthoniobacterales bacterium]